MLISIEWINSVMPEYVKRVTGDDERWHWNQNCPEYPNRGKETVLILGTSPRGVVCQICSEAERPNEGSEAD
jgi:hypothetical protein